MERFIKTFFLAFLSSFLIFIVSNILIHSGNNLEEIILPIGTVIVLLLCYIISQLRLILDKMNEK
ncbi:hypothetical protein EDC24_2693 [Aquisalibacillus elongatus]|uniref:Uncharacterized protein n=1 Tax=Aquisalibacillus elongatus TaxID=485577 RepID=A0A3N5AZ72_9BACI|nr:hypothetical protein EDC24_2693 [Aquisalibacillus elongatus]